MMSVSESIENAERGLAGLAKRNRDLEQVSALVAGAYGIANSLHMSIGLDKSSTLIAHEQETICHQLIMIADLLRRAGEDGLATIAGRGAVRELPVVVQEPVVCMPPIPESLALPPLVATSPVIAKWTITTAPAAPAANLEVSGCEPPVVGPVAPNSTVTAGGTTATPGAYD